jgi:hypothetical protein
MDRSHRAIDELINLLVEIALKQISRKNIEDLEMQNEKSTDRIIRKVQHGLPATDIHRGSATHGPR